MCTESKYLQKDTFHHQAMTYDAKPRGFAIMICMFASVIPSIITKHCRTNCLHHVHCVTRETLAYLPEHSSQMVTISSFQHSSHNGSLQTRF